MNYLNKESERVFDPIVYDALQGIVSRYDRSQRTVQMVQNTVLISNALFYNDNYGFGYIIYAEFK